MTAELITPTADDIETRRDRALRRTQQLHHAFQSIFETLTEIYHDEDWRYINDPAGRPYSTFTAFVQDQLACAASNARRYQQGIVGLILPLRELTAPGARIPITSSDVARLGVTGARAVIEEAPQALADTSEPDEQTAALRELIDSVITRTTDPGFGPLNEKPTPALGELVPAALPPSPRELNDAAEPPPATPPPVPSVAEGGIDRDPPNVDDESYLPAPPGVDGDAPSPEPPPGPASPPKEPAPHLAALATAIEAILAAGDPAEMAARITEGVAPELASKCLTSGQRLVRLGQLLQTLG